MRGWLGDEKPDRRVSSQPYSLNGSVCAIHRFKPLINCIVLRVWRWFIVFSLIQHMSGTFIIRPRHKVLYDPRSDSFRRFIYLHTNCASAFSCCPLQSCAPPPQSATSTFSPSHEGEKSLANSSNEWLKGYGYNVKTRFFPVHWIWTHLCSFMFAHFCINSVKIRI